MKRLILLLFIFDMFFSFTYAGSLIFYPPEASYSDDSNIIKIEVENKQSISAINIPSPNSQYTLLFSHGNAEDIGQNLDFFRLCQKNGFSVFAYDYRGYGTSDGQPSELNTYQDILAAYHYLTEKLHTDPNDIIVYGRSVGSGPSCYLASREPVGGLILESAFTSISRVAIGMSLPFDPYNNLSRIQKVRCPVLVIHGKRNSIVPFRHGQVIYEAANEPKMNYWVENAGHNDLFYQAGSEYWSRIRAFQDMLNNFQKQGDEGNGE